MLTQHRRWSGVLRRHPTRGVVPRGFSEAGSLVADYGRRLANWKLTSTSEFELETLHE
jgi:hypothetical protein